MVLQINHSNETVMRRDRLGGWRNRDSNQQLFELSRGGYGPGNLIRIRAAGSECVLRKCCNELLIRIVIII